MGRLTKAYKGAAKLIGQYWTTYGGWNDLLVSPYLHVSLLLAVITYGTWTESSWWDQVLTIVPSLLGFSLGTLAIFLGFGSERFRDVISGKRSDAMDKVSPYMLVTAAFTHFIVVQIAAVTVAVVSAALFKLPGPAQDSVFFVANDTGRTVLWAVGYWLFLYALCLAGASVLAVFRIAGWYDAHRTKERSDEAAKIQSSETNRPQNQ